MTEKKFNLGPATYAQDSLQGLNRMAPAATLGQRSYNGAPAMQPKPSGSSTSNNGSANSSSASSNTNASQSSGQSGSGK